MQPLILLHGALGATDLLRPLEAALAPHYQVHTFNFSGHGGSFLPAEGLSISGFAAQLLQYMEVHNLHGAAVFGYSMGGYVAFQLLKNHPGTIGKLITLATKFHWDSATAERECAMLQWEKIEAKLPQFAAALAQRHAPENWKSLMEAIAVMLRTMGSNPPLKTEDYLQMNTPVLLVLGDRDKMVSLEETRVVFEALPYAAMGMLPATPHALEGVNPILLGTLIRQFLEA